MIIYFVLPLIPVTFYIIFKREKYQSYGLLIGSVFVLLLFVSTFRSYNMGPDYNGYVYACLHDYNWPEKGFALIIKAVHYIFGKNYWGLALLVNIFYLVPIYFILIKYIRSNYIVLILSIFVLNPYLFIQSTFNVIRQGMACGLLIGAFYFFKNKRYILFVGAIVLSATIHDICRYFWLFLVIVLLFKWNEIKLFYVATFCLLVNLGLRDLTILSKFLSKNRFDSYLSWGDSLFNFVGFSFVIYALLIILLSEYRKLYTCQDEKKWVDLYILSLCFLMIAVKNDIVYRMYMMLAYISLPSIGIIFKNLKNNGSKFIQILTVAYPTYYFIMYVLFLYSVRNNLHYIPFEFYKPY